MEAAQRPTGSLGGFAYRLLLVLVLVLAAVASTCLCMPNIRIQVNNENLQSPPYLLEAIRQAETSEAAAMASNVSLVPQPQPQPSAQATDSSSTSSLDPVTSDQRLALAELPVERQQNGSAATTTFNLIKEETIEEIIELEPPDSASKLLASSSSSNDARISANFGQNGTENQSINSPSTTTATNDHPEISNANEATSNNERPARRKPQLPVTSSHLKRPFASALGDGEHEELGTAGHPLTAGSLLSETRAQMDDEEQAAVQVSRGFQSATASDDSLGRLAQPAKSRVSPSVAEADEGAPVAVNLERKPGQQPPDTLEVSQVMAGVANASLVPATVTRQYGPKNSRTRITLGGGYVRNKLPALINPNASEQAEAGDKRREKTEATQVENEPNERPAADERKPLHENSRLIEVPERIVLPASVFTQNKQQQQALQNQQKILGDNTFLLINVTTSGNENNNNNKPFGKPDSRCPPTGSSTLEHPSACDRYFYCEDGHISEHACPNGLMYGTRNLIKDYCVHRWEAVCGDKSVPNPISSPGCRWQWGIFSVQGSPRCTPDFYECREGEFEVRKCSVQGQVYDDRTKSCRFAEQVGCAEEALADFQCPPDDQANTYWPFPRYFLNERALIHCVNDKPAIVRCRDNERVDPEHLHCVLMSKSSQGETNDAPASRSLRERSKNDTQKIQDN